MSKIYGYCRISTPNQSLERQERNIKEQFPMAIIFKESFTGKSLERPMWTKLYNQLKEGDIVIFDEVSRMSRNAEEGYALYKELYNKNISLIFLKERHIDTSVYKESKNNSLARTGNEVADVYIEATEKVLMILAEKQIKLAFETSQHEIDFMSQRTKEGIETARIKGKQIGAKEGATFVIKNKKPIQALIRKNSKSFAGKNTDAQVIAIINSTKYQDANGLEKCYHISNNTYYKYKREIIAEL